LILLLWTCLLQPPMVLLLLTLWMALIDIACTTLLLTLPLPTA
jgi:hypothetical protein